MNNIDIVILAAGKGTRMKSDLPKVLQHLAGRPLLSHVMAAASGFSGARTILVTGHGAEQVDEQFAGDNVFIARQEQQLGTAHAVQAALPHVRSDATVLVLYGDVPLIQPETLHKLVAQVNDQTLALLTVNLDNPSGYGRIVRNDQGAVARIVEQKDASDEEKQIGEVNTGILALTAENLQQWLPKIGNRNAQGEYYLTDLIALAVADNKKIAVCQPQSVAEVEGVNDRLQLNSLERIYQRQLAEQLMRDGAQLADASRIDIRGSLRVGRDVFIDINAVFEGDVVLGDGVHIGPNCHIIDSALGNGVEIKSHTVIESAVISDRAVIGPFARLRPGTRLAENTKVGNFVETKKAIVGKGSKINHLSYVGDAELGENVNVGAGTITCNYDGVNKHKTTIKDGAFIGSNSALVAPVTIGENATVGAGSTITKNVADEELALTRAKQMGLKNWKRPVKTPSVEK